MKDKFLIRMNEFIKANKWNLSLLFIFALFIIGVWNSNIYQLWFRFSPQENLGSPPKQAEKIVALKPIFDYSINNYKTYVFVQTKDGDIYRCCSWHDTKDWVKSHEFLTDRSSGEFACTEDIKRKWNITEDYKSAISTLSLGSCPDSGMDLYSSYQINQDGTISGKTVRENFVEEFFAVFQNRCMWPVSIVIFAWSIFKLFVNRNVKSVKAKQI